MNIFHKIKPCFVVHKTSTVFFIALEVLAMEIREEIKGIPTEKKK